MFRRHSLSINGAIAVGALLIAAVLAAFAQSHHHAANGRGIVREVAAADGTMMVQSVEGGVQSGGYIDGRPVPSGFNMPVVIRYKSGEPETSGVKSTPIEAGAVAQ
jgi:hypothetical protein